LLHLVCTDLQTLQVHPAIQKGVLPEENQQTALRLVEKIMKLIKPKTKEGLNNRLRRIEGQVKGVQTMVTEERDCRELLQQISAIRSALQGVTLALVEDYASDCLLNQVDDDPAKRQELVKDLITLIGKTP
jgi:DNA-binding FrmR family transcriptional regulator